MTQLVVTSPFGSYGRGTPITDPTTIAAILSGPNHIFVVRVPDSAGSGGGIVTPLLPNAYTPVVGAPDPALAVTYGFALDLTSTPATLYKWSGTAWVIVLQAGVGGGTSPPLTAPGAIAAAPTSSAVTASSLTLAWVAPTTGGAPTDYLVQYKRSVDPTWITVDEASTQLAATVSGLLAATSYDVRVQATNSAGQGAASPILTVSTSAAAPVLQPLGLASLAAVAGQPFSAAITGQTAGSAIAATSSDGTVLTVANGQVSGTFTPAGQPTITLTEILAGATGSPKSTQLAVTVSAAQGAQPAGIGADLNDAMNTTLL